MTPTKLTTLEKDVLQGMYRSDYADGRDNEPIDVWTFSLDTRIVTPKQLPGVIASLKKKGLVGLGGDGTKDNEYSISTTQAGFRAWKSIKDEVLSLDKKAPKLNQRIQKAVNDAATRAKLASMSPAEAVANISPEDLISVLTRTVRVGPSLEIVLALDEPDNLHGAIISKRTKGYIEITGTKKSLNMIREDCDGRMGPGWDQPLWYQSVAKAAAQKIRAVMVEAK